MRVGGGKGRCLSSHSGLSQQFRLSEQASRPCPLPPTRGRGPGYGFALTSSRRWSPVGKAQRSNFSPRRPRARCGFSLRLNIASASPGGCRGQASRPQQGWDRISVYWVKMFNAGQICTNVDYMFLPKGSEDEFVRRCRRLFTERYPDINGRRSRWRNLKAARAARSASRHPLLC